MMTVMPPSSMFLSRHKAQATEKNYQTADADFGYLPAGSCYLDSACQTLRPQAVLDAEMQYYQGYNACGGRVKYPWGVRVDREVSAVRQKLLAYAGKSAKQYTVVFTLNTTYGINLILQQLPAADFTQIVTSEIEHNSAFLPTITWSKRHGKERKVLSRADNGELLYDAVDLEKAVVLLNTASNIDGRELGNAPELATLIHERSGLLLLDAAQSFGHNVELLRQTDFDAAFGSGHKMYGPSLGFVIVKKDLLKRLDVSLVGGGTVQDVRKDSFDLIDSDDEPYARAELGLQNWAGIIGLGAAIDWMEASRATQAGRERALAEQLFAGLQAMPKVHPLNREPSPIISFHVDGLDAHR
ncbi:MAG: aminotransferase class V-fold PLP-dependent enzyme, partial [Candidatus Peribacteraceae bacterium]|nr:aminotransferase class V-fold PLP-dependent enzyme [Candidatus Peribacteraceae bacterium]